MIWAYLAGLLTLPIGWAVLAVTWWSLGRTHGSGGCMFCEHIPHWEIGERFNITAWLIFRWHRVWWARQRWHKTKAAEYWAKRRR